MVADAHLQPALCPAVRKPQDRNVEDLRVSFRDGLRNDSDADTRLDHAACGFEAANLDAGFEAASDPRHYILKEKVDGTCRGQADKLLSEKIREGNSCSARERVIARSHDAEPVHPAGEQLQFAGKHGSSDDTDIGGVGCYTSDDVFAQHLLQIDVHIGKITKELAQHRRKEITDRTRVCPNPDVAFYPAAIILHIARQMFHLVEHDTRVMQQRFSRRCKAHTSASAVKQLHSKLFFEVLHANAGGRRRYGTSFSRPGQIARVGNVGD